MKIVVDTNVLIAAILTHSPTITAVLAACRNGQVTLVVSKPLLQEIGRVLHRPKLRALHQMSDVQISHYIADLATFAEVVPGTTFVDVSPDPKDNMFFACAVEAGATYIVSGDTHHVLSIRAYQGIRTLSPADFVETVLNMREHAA